MTPLRDSRERPGTPRWPSRARYAFAAAVASGAALAAYAWWESTRTQVVHHRVVVPDLPPGLDGLRILHVSDTHFPANGASLERFAELIAELEYDIVFATGDYVETAAGWDTAVEAFSLLHAPLGVYASLGAHDYLSPVSTVAEWTDAALHRLLGGHRKLVDPSPFTNRLEALGVRVLRNARAQLEINGEILRIAAAGDDSVGMARLDLALPPDPNPPSTLKTIAKVPSELPPYAGGSVRGSELPPYAGGSVRGSEPPPYAGGLSAQADWGVGAEPEGGTAGVSPRTPILGGAPQTPSSPHPHENPNTANDLTVLLTHSPDAVLRLQRPPPLIFCGHTHGGQIRIPGYGALVRHSRLVDRRQTAGVFQYRNAQVIVSQGFGTAVIPLRLLCPPQLAVIELAAGSSASGDDSDS